MQNYFPAIWPQTWSLAVEEHFYFLLALLAAILVRWDVAKRREGPTGQSRVSDPFAALVPIFGVVAVVALIIRIVAATHGTPSFYHNLFPTHLRLDSLLFGVLLSYLVWSRGEAVSAWVRSHRPHLVLRWLHRVALPCTGRLRTADRPLHGDARVRTALCRLWRDSHARIARRRPTGETGRARRRVAVSAEQAARRRSRHPHNRLYARLDRRVLVLDIPVAHCRAGMASPTDRACLGMARRWHRAIRRVRRHASITSLAPSWRASSRSRSSHSEIGGSRISLRRP